VKLDVSESLEGIDACVSSSDSDTEYKCMRGIKKVRAIYYFLCSTKGTQEQIYCHFST
jgi:hypothetical protein